MLKQLVHDFKKACKTSDLIGRARFDHKMHSQLLQKVNQAIYFMITYPQTIKENKK